jgi:uncharacterized protein
MRLTETEITSIKTLFLKYKKSDSVIYLFGSRTDHTKKGGDIDLLISFETKDSLISFQKLDFIVELKKAVGDRKIDITLATVEDLKTDEFLISILSGCLLI